MSLKRTLNEDIPFRIKRIYQKDLTADCWSVQVWGLPHCRECDYLATEDCGGYAIRKRIFGGQYPTEGLPDVHDK
jgi:hypothetical protein